MCGPANLQLYGTPETKEEERYLYMLFTKTQYAGIEIHKLIVHLFKYLERKYLLDLQVSDEGEYWETGDEKILEEAFKRYTALVENFTRSLENFPKEAGETYEGYFERLLKQMEEKNQK